MILVAGATGFLGREIPMQDTLRAYGLRFIPVREYARHAVAS